MATMSGSPGQVDVLGSPVGLRGEPVGQQPRAAEEAIGHGRALVRAGKRSQKCSKSVSRRK